MFRSLRSVLASPFPRSEGYRRRLTMIIGTAVFVSLFLAIFRPFGLHSLDSIPSMLSDWQILAGYGVITGLCMAFVGLCVPALLPSLYRESSWTAGREIAELTLTIAMIGLGNTVFTAIVFSIDMSTELFIGFQLITAAIGVFPATVLVLLQLLRYRSVFVTGARHIESALRHSQQTHSRPVVQIRDDEGRTVVVVDAAALLLLTAADNYVECTIDTGSGTRTTLVRTSLKSLEDKGILPLCFWRCHRSHIVNLDRVDHVSGTAQGYRLTVGPLQSVPVSRSRSTELRLVMQSRSRIPGATEGT
jgi:DNA-binding LytR/AlgR family response regulator